MGCAIQIWRMHLDVLTAQLQQYILTFKGCGGRVFVFTIGPELFLYGS